MEIWVYNQYNDQREIVKVSDSNVQIGRDEGNDITLRSPFVSRRHARIIYEGGSFFVESLGLNGVIVANREVPKGARRKIEYGDEIRIGEYSIYMMEPSLKRIKAGEVVISPRRRVVELEQTMHAELLDRLNLRVTSEAGSADARHVRLIKRHLVDIIETVVFTFEDGDL